MTPAGGPDIAPRPRWSRVAGALGALALGGVLLFAAGAKALDPAAFGQEIGRQGLLFGLPARLAALAAIALEAALGAALVVNLRRTPVLVVATLLAALFVAITGRDYWRAVHGLLDPAAGCGCFGNLVERTPGQAFWQDLAMLLPPLALAWLGRPGARRATAARLALALAVGGGAAAFAWKAPELPLDDLATRLAPGVQLSRLCAGRDAQRVCLEKLVPALATGSHLVVIADVADARFGELVELGNRYAASSQASPLTVLAEFTPEQQQKIFWTYAPAFDLEEVPGALLRPLYRKLPRSFRVEDGRVTATWPGMPPLELAARVSLAR